MHIRPFIKKSIGGGLLLYSTLTISLGQQPQQTAQQPSFVRDSLEAYIQKGMQDWQIPGLAITIVKDGRVVIEKGFGVQQVEVNENGQTAPVDENTLFLIASNTKLFTATALALLDKEKKISLDDPVLKYLPAFSLHDKTATRLVTIRDLCSHRLGTASFQGDFTVWDSNLSRQEVIQRMRYLPPHYPFRQEFGYSNAAFVTAGEVIPKVTGLSWDNYIEKNILRPLGMNHTYMLTEGISSQANLAQPYTTCCNSEGKLARLPMNQLDNLGAATGMVSNVSDLTKWLLMQTDSGRINKKSVIPWSVVNKTRQANTIVSTQKHPYFPLKFQFYCLGIGLLDYAGSSAFVHTGGAFGYHTNLAFVPELNLGFAILTNQDNNKFYEALLWQILDAYLNVPFTNRHEYFYSRAKVRERKNQEEIKAMAARVKRAKPLPLPISGYTGTYLNPLYGTITLQKENAKEGLLMHFQHHPNLTAQLDYMDSNEFRLTFSNPRWGITPVKFKLSGKQVDSVEMRVSDFVDSEPYVFSKSK